jgi:hypothetical protein
MSSIPQKLFPVMNFEVLYIGFYLRAVQTTTHQVGIVSKYLIYSQLLKIKVLMLFYNDRMNSHNFSKKYSEI